jgi:hypothetical protein
MGDSDAHLLPVTKKSQRHRFTLQCNGCSLLDRTEWRNHFVSLLCVLDKSGILCNILMMEPGMGEFDSRTPRAALITEEPAFGLKKAAPAGAGSKPVMNAGRQDRHGTMPALPIVPGRPALHPIRWEPFRLPAAPASGDGTARPSHHLALKAEGPGTLVLFLHSSSDPRE